MAQIRFVEADRVRIRYHLGYLNVEPVVSVQLGYPSAQQSEFLVEQAMDRCITQAIPRVLAMLDTLDCIEGRMVGALKRLQVQSVGDITIRSSNDERTEGDLLELEYKRWAYRLAEMLGCPVNPYATRFRQGDAINTHVVV